MKINYHNLSFGAQLLIWTSRVIVNGKCSTMPDKYQLTDLAFKKVGINNGTFLLKEFLNYLKNNKSFKLQHLCTQILDYPEINLIKCVEEHQKSRINNTFYLKLWSLENNKKAFTRSACNLSMAFKNANLNTDLGSNLFKENIQNTEYLISKTLH